MAETKKRFLGRSARHLCGAAEVQDLYKPPWDVHLAGVDRHDTEARQQQWGSGVTGTRERGWFCIGAESVRGNGARMDARLQIVSFGVCFA